MKQDQMSMAASIESRVPFLDHVLVEFTARIPAQYSIQGMAGKFILKQAVEDLAAQVESCIARRWDFPLLGSTGWPDRNWTIWSGCFWSLEVWSVVCSGRRR